MVPGAAMEPRWSWAFGLPPEFVSPATEIGAPTTPCMSEPLSLATNQRRHKRRTSECPDPFRHWSNVGISKHARSRSFSRPILGTPKELARQTIPVLSHNMRRHLALRRGPPKKSGSRCTIHSSSAVLWTRGQSGMLAVCHACRPSRRQRPPPGIVVDPWSRRSLLGCRMRWARCSPWSGRSQ